MKQNHRREQSDPSERPLRASSFATLLDRRISRRGLLAGTLGGALMVGAGWHLGRASRTADKSDDGPFTFGEISRGIDETHHLAVGYEAEVLVRWGDPLFADAPAFAPEQQSPAAQERQFGYNNDYIGFLPLPSETEGESRGLICVNHEYTNRDVMFPVRDRNRLKAHEAGAEALVAIEMSAQGGSIIELRRGQEGWRVQMDSPYNRRISARTTAMEMTGPAAGHARLKTPSDPTGRRVIGTFANCAGGMTPWGTYLMAEENFHGYFVGDFEGHPEAAAFQRYGVPRGWYSWASYDRRFDIEAEPLEANRFGWIVEVDPLDPSSVPKKRTALGRAQHEGAETILNGDGRVVVYSGDDAKFEYLYRFVSDGVFQPENRRANMDLLDHGVLSVARFAEDGTLEWLPLIYGQEPLVPANGFHSQADVVIEARRAGDLLEATPMDRPEDIEPNPVTGKVYVNLTNNSKRTSDAAGGPNPRAKNRFGHIVELSPPNGDHRAVQFRWDILVLCGNPADAESGALWNERTSQNGWFAAPDNAAVDHRGGLWIATDQGHGATSSGTADGLWALETEGVGRGTGRMFFRAPIGSEVCGPCFTPDDRTLFLAVQHPAIAGAKSFPGFEKDSTFEDPATRWPDFRADLPVRPAVLAITKADGGLIGT